MTDVATDASSTQRTVGFTGRLGLWAVLILVVVLAIHPLGSTSLYDDPVQFLEHVTSYWVVIHMAAAIGLLAFPLIVDTWSKHLATPEARVLGRGATLIAVLGMGIGMIHLTGTDTMTFVAFRDTFEASGGSEAGLVGVDVLLRLHAATFTAWVSSFFLTLPLVLGFAVRADGRLPRWMAWIAWAAAALQIAALSITFAERQLTTLSEQILFRSGATLMLIWFLVTTMWMRRGSVTGATA
ncbi:MAG: hypothetical protein QNJ88_10940 [Acidimicrobiia bacterium]|nr:hypothetical protein [Acidimicrobiia bacterium]